MMAYVLSLEKSLVCCRSHYYLCWGLANGSRGCNNGVLSFHCRGILSSCKIRVDHAL